MRYLLGLDIGSSSVKCALLDIETGRAVATAHSPSTEMIIESPRQGCAEQDPSTWWKELCIAVAQLKEEVACKKDDVAAIGISYQMHGLVAVDKNGEPVRPAIIWCDGRAVDLGRTAFQSLGQHHCLSHYLNSPGNLTASKLKWVKDNEPDVYARIHKVMLPGDYIAYRLTGEMRTTLSGLSEGVMWDVQSHCIAHALFDYYGINESLICASVPQFGEQGRLTAAAADALGLAPEIPITYRAGDQPNNAYSLNVLEPGEVAATAGTSGVVYGVIDTPSYDERSRVNTFIHVNHQPQDPRYGVLLCINGTGILNSWLQKNAFAGLSYPEINQLASKSPIGAEGLLCFPFGNGAERVLENSDPGSTIRGLHFNRHNRSHLARAAQEGIVFSLFYGIEIMMEMGLSVSTVRAGKANMFLSEVFTEAFVNTTGACVELFNTDGAQGAARAAGAGAKVFANRTETFKGLQRIARFEPDPHLQSRYREAYFNWRTLLNKGHHP